MPPRPCIIFPLPRWVSWADHVTSLLENPTALRGQSAFIPFGMNHLVRV